jgi:two-component sensor histidine kinase
MLDPKAQRLRLQWTERDGPAVRAPDRRSFGTRLVETLGKQLKGEVHLEYEPSGFVYTFDVPVSSLTSM